MSRNILFISVETIKERTGVHNNLDEKLINPEIMTAQDMYLLPCLGTGLYERLQDGIENNDLTVSETTLLDTYITPCLVHFVLSELPMGISFQFYNKGLVRKTDAGISEPSAQDLIDVANRYRTRAEFYKQRLIKYLKQQSATNNNFPLYLNPGNGIDTILPDNEGYSASIWLGDDCNCGGSFEDKYQGDNPNCC